ncbi:MAG: histidine kinase [Verrucomicrobiota bacterium]
MGNLLSLRASQSWREFLIRLLVLAAGVYLVTKGLAWVQSGGQAAFISPLWPACGIGLAGMLVWGGRMWPAIYVPMCLSSFAAGDAVAFSIFAPAGLTASLWGACRGLKLLKFEKHLPATRDVVVLVLAGAIAPMALAGLWNAAMLVLTGMMPHGSLVQTAIVYAIANATGIVVVTPLILLAAARRNPGRRWQEWAILGALLGSVWLAFSMPGHQTVLAYLPFPFLVWLALTGGLPMAALGVLGAVAGAVGFSSRGMGPFAGGVPLANFAQIELYIGIFTTTGLLLGAGAEAQRREMVLRAIAAAREAEMERIKAQIHPHFLFNCLAAIHSLVKTNTDAARSGIIALSDLLRASLDTASVKFIPLGREIKMIESYLALQRMRFEDALESKVECPAAAAMVPVPPMLIQPLVENAIKHGVDDDGHVAVKVLAYENADGLCVVVKNTVPASVLRMEQWRDGVGLASVKKRMEEAWGSRATLTFSREDPNWLVATILIMKGEA